jgi:hypothetical protein
MQTSWSRYSTVHVCQSSPECKITEGKKANKSSQYHDMICMGTKNPEKATRRKKKRNKDNSYTKMPKRKDLVNFVSCLSCFGSTCRRLLLHDALEHSANIIDELVRLVLLKRAEPEILFEPHIRVQQFPPIPNPPRYGGGRGRDEGELLSCPLRLCRSICHCMLELLDPCSSLVQPAKGHQQLIMMVLAIIVAMMNLRVGGNGGSDQLPPLEGVLLPRWIIRRFIFCIRKKGTKDRINVATSYIN